MTLEPSHRGHCRCEAVVITARGEPELTVYCHCDDCRRATGAPVLASVGFPKIGITWEADDTLKRYKEGTATRLFCSNCGSPVAWEHDSADHMTFFNTGFMDNPNDFPPTYHTFAGQKLEWLELHDDLRKVDKTIMIQTK